MNYKNKYLWFKLYDMKELRKKLKQSLIEFDTEYFLTEVFVAVLLSMTIVLLTGAIWIKEIGKYLYNKIIK